MWYNILYSMRKAKSNKKDRFDFNLLKSTSAVNDTVKKYAELVKDAVLDPGVKGIALLGGYCTGKSSIIDTFVGLYDKKDFPWWSSQDSLRVKRISLVNLHQEGAKASKFTNLLQCEIVKQLYFGEKPSKLKWSKFTRINATNNRAILFFLPFFVFFVQLLRNLELFDFGFPSFFLDTDWLAVVSNIIIPVLISYLVSHFVLVNIASKLQIDGFGFSGMSVKLAKKNASFSELIDELIYFFETTGYNVVVFEDLDRFNNEQIYEELRQLNFMLNESKQIKQKITFIYAMKDSLIADASERAKLFEQIIPIIPFLSAHNAMYFVLEELRTFGIAIDKKLAHIVAEELPEKRQIDSFCNIAVLQCNQICSAPLLEWLKEQEAVAMALLRQKYPLEYEELQLGTSRVDVIYDWCVDEKNKCLEELRGKIADRVNISNNAAIVKTKVWQIIDMIAKGRLYNNSEPILQRDDGVTVDEEYIGTEDFWKYLKENRAIFEKSLYHDSGHPDYITLGDIKESNIMDQNTLSIIDNIMNVIDKDENAYRREYVQKRDNAAWSFLSAAGKQEEFGDDKELISLLKRLQAAGCLTDSFRMYIAEYHGDTSSEKVLNFRNNNIIQGNPSYDLRFNPDEIREICDGLTVYDFGSAAFLNFSIINAIINGEVVDVSLENFLLEQKGHINELQSFYDAYHLHCQEQNHKKNFAIFTKTFLGFDSKFIIDYVCKYNLLSKTTYFYPDLPEVLLEYIAKNNLDLSDSVKTNIRTNVDSLYAAKPELTIAVLRKYKILISNVNSITTNGNLRGRIVESGLFEINVMNMHSIKNAPVDLALSYQELSSEKLSEIFSGKVDKDSLQALLEYVFKNNRALLTGIEKEAIQAINRYGIIVSIGDFRELIGKIDENESIRYISNVCDNLDIAELLPLLTAVGGVYEKLTQPGKQLWIKNDEPHRKIVKRLVGEKVIKRMIFKNGDTKVGGTIV